MNFHLKLIKMPREYHPLIRKSGFLQAEKFYILGYEGTVTERKYFEDLRLSSLFNDSGSIETIPLKHKVNDGNSPIDVKRLLSKAKADYNFRSTDEFWLVIDRDDWSEIHHVDFDALYEECEKEKNFYIALSNPCFEIWLIFHLRKLSEISAEDQSKIFENAKVSAKHNFIDTYLSDCIGNGRGYNKRPLPEIFLPKINEAIANASECSNQNEKYPKWIGTDVYKLVQKLIK